MPATAPDPEWVKAIRPANTADRRLRVLLAGSRSLPRGTAIRLLIRFVASLPDDAIILVRDRVGGAMGWFEREVVDLCKIARLAYQPCVAWPIVPREDIPDPDPEEVYIGREGVLLRDRTMVDLADLVLAFVTEREMASAEHSGTRHIVEAAFARDKPVFLYEVDSHGNAEQVGANDPDNAWSAKVPG